MERNTQWLVTIAVLAMLLFSFSVASALLIPVNANKKEDEPRIEVIELKLYAKPDKPDNPNKPDKKPKETVCYDLLGAKWKDNNIPFTYYYDYDNTFGIYDSQMQGAITESFNAWENNCNRQFIDYHMSNTNLALDGDTPDGKVEFLFGDYDESGVIAVCFVYGYFKGKPDNRQIIEFDILFDTDYTWGYNIDKGDPYMDFQNIATHEIGHGLGLGDLYDTDCSEETMYGYSDYGEIKKRDINTGDKAGIQELYGAPPA